MPTVYESPEVDGSKADSQTADRLLALNDKFLHPSCPTAAKAQRQYRLKIGMRRQGKIARWNDERGFGFISSAEGGDSVFVHISSFPGGARRPSVSEVVSYTLAFDSHGRPQAKDVRFITGSSSAPSRQIPRSGISVPIAFAISFLIALAALVGIGWLEISWLGLYYVASIITYGCYSRDKAAAQNAGRRTPELTLHLMSLIGGWPGALIAQVLLRHKTRKSSFLVGYWFTVIVNCLALGVIVGKGVSPAKTLLGVAIKQALTER